MPTNIPKARVLLAGARGKLGKTMHRYRHDAELSDELIRISNEISVALSLMTRSVKPNGRTRRAKVTSSIVQGVLDMKEANPEMHYDEIGEYFNINGGRVSEILNGLRTVANPSMKADGLNRKMTGEED